MDAYVTACEKHNAECIYEVVSVLAPVATPTRGNMSDEATAEREIKSELRLTPQSFYDGGEVVPPRGSRSALDMKDAQLSGIDLECILAALESLTMSEQVQERVAAYGPSSLVRVLDLSSAVRDESIELQLFRAVIEAWAKGLQATATTVNKWFVGNRQLRELLLGLANAGLTSAHVVELCAALKTAIGAGIQVVKADHPANGDPTVFQWLTSLVLSNNAMGLGGPSNSQTTLSTLAQSMQCIRHLDVGNNNLQMRSTNCVRSMSKILHSATLETLNLSGNEQLLDGLTAHDVIACFHPPGTSHMAALRRLDLSGCGIGRIDRALNAVVQMLLSNASLEWVNLRSNAIEFTNANAEALSDVMLQCTNIAALLLGDNLGASADVDAVTNLFVALGSNKTLQMVDLSSIPLQQEQFSGRLSPVDDAAGGALVVGALTDFIRGSPALKRVYLTLPDAVDSPTKAHLRGQLNYLTQPPMHFSYQPTSSRSSSNTNVPKLTSKGRQRKTLPAATGFRTTRSNKPASRDAGVTPPRQLLNQPNIPDSPITPSATNSFSGYLKKVNKERRQRGLFDVDIVTEYNRMEAVSAMVGTERLNAANPPVGYFQHLTLVNSGTGIRLGSPAADAASRMGSSEPANVLVPTALQLRTSESPRTSPPAGAPTVKVSTSPDPEPVARSAPPPAAPPQATKPTQSTCDVKMVARWAQSATDIIANATQWYQHCYEAEVDLFAASKIAAADCHLADRESAVDAHYRRKKAKLEQQIEVVDEWAKRVDTARESFLRRETELMQQHEQDVDTIRFLEAQNTVLQRRVEALMNFSASQPASESRHATPLHPQFAADVASLMMATSVKKPRASPHDYGDLTAPAAVADVSAERGLFTTPQEKDPEPTAPVFASASPLHAQNAPTNCDSSTLRPKLELSPLRLSREALEQHEFKTTPRSSRRADTANSPQAYVDDQAAQLQKKQLSKSPPRPRSSTRDHQSVPTAQPVMCSREASAQTQEEPREPSPPSSPTLHHPSTTPPRGTRDVGTTIDVSQSTQTTPIQERAAPRMHHALNPDHSQGREPSPLPTIRMQPPPRSSSNTFKDPSPSAQPPTSDSSPLMKMAKESIETQTTASMPRTSAAPSTVLQLPLYDVQARYPRFREAYRTLPPEEASAFATAWLQRFDSNRRQAEMYDVLQKCAERGMFEE